MNWTKASAIAEIVSSFAILVTLIFLVVQTRQSAEAIQTSLRTGDGPDLLQSQLDNLEMWAQMHNAEYTDEQKVYFGAWLVAYCTERQVDWINYREGTLDEQTWAIRRFSIAEVFKTRNFRVWWSNLGTRAFDPEFVVLVNDILAETPPSDENNALVQWE